MKKLLSKITVLAVLIGFLVPVRAGYLSGSDELSDSRPGIGVIHTITFDNIKDIGNSGQVRFLFDSSFDFSYFIATNDIEVFDANGGTFDLANASVDKLTNIVTVPWTVEPNNGDVIIKVRKILNPTVEGSYNVTVQAGPDGVTTSHEGRYQVAVTEGVTVSATVTANQANPVLDNIVPSYSPITIGRNSSVQIFFDITDVNDDDVAYTITPPVILGGAILELSLNPATNTQAGTTVSFIYFSSFIRGTDNIVVSISDGIGGDDPTNYNIPVKVTR